MAKAKKLQLCRRDSGSVGSPVEGIQLSDARFRSPTVVNLFLENVMQEILDDPESTIKINDRVLSDLRFADNIDLTGGTDN